MSKKKKKKAAPQSSGPSPFTITAVGITLVVILAGIGAGVLIAVLSSDDGHESNLDCFIKSRDGDDVEFDRHGAG